MSDLIDSLRTELLEFSIDVKDDFLMKMKELCLTHDLNAENMVDNWVAFTSSRNCSSTLEFLTQFEREELMKQNKSRKSFNKKKLPTRDSDFDLDRSFLGQQTPERPRPTNIRSPRLPFSPNSFSPVPSTPSLKYASRKTSGEVVFTFGNIQNDQWSNSHTFSCSIEPFDKESALQSQYPYMFEKFRDYASVLNDMIEDMAVHFQKAYEVEEWMHLQLPSLEPAPLVGRICSDNTTKLNAQSLFLEGSLETSSGQVLPLDVDHLEKFSFFPGQIIAGCGMNNLGKKIIMKELYEGVDLPFSDKVPEFEDPENTLHIVIAAGPYTTSDTLSYEPLSDFINYLKANKPHACIMCGPFVDIKHEEIKKGNLPNNYEDLFNGLINTITSSLENISTKIVLVPSIRDAFHDPIYPTPPYEIQSPPPNIYLASDPCVLKINGVVFGITSSDILLHLGKEEINFPPQSSDRLSRLCSHVLNQKNLYPLYPPSEDMSMDYVHFETHAMLPVTPHILVLPSDLRNFIKDVNGCCCINPERLTKHSVGGLFARLKIKPIDPETYSGSIINSIQAEIVRI